MKIVIFGLSITSSWGNGQATTYRALLRGFAKRGHEILFLERDVPWYAENRDLPNPPYCRTELYASLDECKDRFAREVRNADVVMVGSYVPQGVTVGGWVIETARGLTVFYDIDTPVTLAKLERGDEEYLSPGLIPRYELYLTFTGGPAPALLEQRFGAQRARVLYCSVDADQYRPADLPPVEVLGYLGTYAVDRQPALEKLLIEPARQLPHQRFSVVGPQYPGAIEWPANVRRMDHLAPADHPAFYNSLRFTLNVTRADMVRAGYSPSVRLFEAAACAVPIISDDWPGLDSVFRPNEEILIANSTADTLRYLQLPDEPRRRIAKNGRERVLQSHTGDCRAAELEQYLNEALDARAGASAAMQIQ